VVVVPPVGAELREALFFKLLQLVARQARIMMNTRFFNIFSTFEDIGTGKDNDKNVAKKVHTPFVPSVERMCFPQTNFVS